MTLNQIIGNKERKSKIDTNLWKKMNDKYSGIENKTEKKTNNQVTENIGKRIQYYIIGKPTLDLKQLENTVINARTQKEYDTLMQIYEGANWKHWWNNGQATQRNVWPDAKKETCLRTQELFCFDIKKNYENEQNIKIISTKEFYNIQNIKPKDIKELNTWYDKNKPNRTSKG